MALYTIVNLLGYAYQIYSFLIIAYILMSWLPNVRESRVGEILGKIVEPYLKPFRKLIPPIGGMIDISPMLAIFALWFIYQGIIGIIVYIARWL
ncbi:YggT family protein [Gorillibacterium timonense]|uniref:YggT family protein n=1 Tax=Gorillibacterium timonense TaxID=1689269 RepID=UPI00071E4226|nr:YggT family protein [Gorillibacterium timonense]